jgi:CO dehydrogenase nickel-insertion accessory protein CooC1
MILSFLGKGGSGKTSLATQTLFQLKDNSQVLAVDADHNMDFAFNATRGEVPKMNHLGSALDDALDHVGLDSDEKYTKAFLEQTSARFLFGTDKDNFTEKYTEELGENVHVMASGPQTDRVLYGQSCSHFLSTPLKLYLPLLNLDDDAVVLVDEKAGADGASTGIVSGVDVGVIASEPSLHGAKTANQIAEIMDFFETPYLFVGNKVETEEDKKFLSEELVSEPTIYLQSERGVKRSPFEAADAWDKKLATILRQAQELNRDDRLERTVDKFQRNHSFQS